MITNTKVVFFILILVIIDYIFQIFHNKEINVQILYNLYPTLILFGLCGIILIDLEKGKVQEIMKINGWSYVSTNTANLLSWLLHISMVALPTYILYFTSYPKKQIKNNYYRFLIPLFITIVYKLMIYPKKLYEVYALSFMNL